MCINSDLYYLSKMYRQCVLMLVALSVGLVHSLDKNSITVVLPADGNCMFKSAGYTFTQGSNVSLIVDSEPILIRGYWRAIDARTSVYSLFYDYKSPNNYTITMEKRTEGRFEFYLYYKRDMNDNNTIESVCRIRVTIDPPQTTYETSPNYDELMAGTTTERSSSPEPVTQEAVDDLTETTDKNSITVVLPADGNCMFKSAGYTFTQGSNVSLIVNSEPILIRGYWRAIDARTSVYSLFYDYKSPNNYTITMEKRMEGRFEFYLHYKRDMNDNNTIESVCRIRVTIDPPQTTDETSPNYDELMAGTTTERSSSPEPVPQEAVDDLTETTEYYNSIIIVIPTKSENCSVMSIGYTFTEGSNVTLVLDPESYLDYGLLRIINASGSYETSKNFKRNHTITVVKAMEGIWEFEFHFYRDIMKYDRMDSMEIRVELTSSICRTSIIIERSNSSGIFEAAPEDEIQKKKEKCKMNNKKGSGMETESKFDKTCSNCIYNNYADNDTRNEHFSRLIHEELQLIQPCMRTRVYAKILNLLHTIRNCHSNETDITESGNYN